MAVKNGEDQEGFVFRALADSTRRKILDLLKEKPGINVAELCAHFPTSRFAVMKHLNILEEANLIQREREGNSRKIFLNSEPLKKARNRWDNWI